MDEIERMFEAVRKLRLAHEHARQNGKIRAMIEWVRRELGS